MHATSVPCMSSSTFSAVRRRKNQRSIGLQICISSSPAALSPARQRSSNRFSAFTSTMGRALLPDPRHPMGGFPWTAATFALRYVAVPFPSALLQYRRHRPARPTPTSRRRQDMSTCYILYWDEPVVFLTFLGVFGHQLFSTSRFAWGKKFQRGTEKPHPDRVKLGPSRAL